MTERYRVEHDSMGEVRVPADAHWGAQTQRAVENFPISGRPIAPALVHALALIKAEAARVNRLDAARCDRGAAEEVAGGAHDDQFPIDMFQTGSGTSSNMNANEVIAHLATERLGDAPCTRTITSTCRSRRTTCSRRRCTSRRRSRSSSELVPAVQKLAKALRKKQREFAHEVKSGRTHLMDATPVTLGQEFGGYAAQIEDGIARLDDTMPRLCALPLGGTAVGTGINAPKGFAAQGDRAARDAHRAPAHRGEGSLRRAGRARRARRDERSAARTLAVSLIKIANDLRWMGSGPHTGLAEIRLPDLQPGSSIMPGKVNPVIPEVVTQVGAQVIGNDAAIAFGGSQGNFELNVFVPVIARNLLESIDLLASVCRGVRRQVHRRHRGERRRRSSGTRRRRPSIGTALNPHLGYETDGRDHQGVDAHREVDPRRSCARRKLMTDAELDRALDVEAMTRGGIIE